MQQPHQIPQPPGSFPAQTPSQPIPQNPNQPGPIHPNNSGAQQPLYRQANPAASAPPNFQQQKEQPQEFQPQQPRFPTPQHPQATYPDPQDAIAPAPLQQNQDRYQQFGTPAAGDGGDELAASSTRRGRQARKKLQFGDRNLWTGGQSVVGRKGKDGEWMEVRCVAM